MGAIVYRRTAIDKYLSDLAGDMPAPGGGSASALVAATGVSLLLMVVNFTVGRKGYEKDTAGVMRAKSVLRKIGRRLQALIDEDVRAYNKFARFMKLPKESRDKDEKTAILKNAASVPLEICELCGTAVKEAEFLAAAGNKNLVTDVGCGALCLEAGFNSAEINALINLKYVDDAEYVSRVRGALSSDRASLGRAVKGIMQYLDTKVLTTG
ncbi:MAG: cyclodeaminase/cyclohydrolase family protein [Candidatus Omnitrophota bacterium]